MRECANKSSYQCDSHTQLIPLENVIDMTNQQTEQLQCLVLVAEYTN